MWPSSKSVYYIFYVNVLIYCVTLSELSLICHRYTICLTVVYCSGFPLVLLHMCICCDCIVIGSLYGAKHGIKNSQRQLGTYV